MNHSTLRSLYIVLGSVALGLGVIGIFLPILPTTPFLLLAAFCYSRGSEKMHRWLIEHPYFGPPIRDWNEHHVIRPRAKVISLLTMAAGIWSVWTFFPAHLPYGKYAMIAFMLCVSLFIATRASKPKP